MNRTTLNVALIITLSIFSSSWASVIGTVKDTNGNPLAGVSVTLTYESNPNLRFSDSTDSGGRYDIEISPLSANENTPAPFCLFQNYPNPFNPMTVIPFSLDKAGQIELLIYNSLGQKTRTLISMLLSEGMHHVSWDGLDDGGKPVSAGIYFYQLKSGGRTETKKMLLLDGGQSHGMNGVYQPYSAGQKAFKSLRATGSALFTVTITGEEIIPYMVSGKEIVDGNTYDYVVPGEHDQVQIALVPGKEEPIAAVISSSLGESLGILADKSEDGVIERITGAVYVDENGSALTVWFGEDGLPEVAEANGWIIKFSNFTDSTVDMSFTSSADTVHVEGVAFDSETIKTLRELGSSGIIGKIADPNALYKSGSLLFNDYVAGVIKVASLTVTAVGCAASIASGAVPLLILSCGSLFIKSVELGSWTAGGDRVFGKTGDTVEFAGTAVTSFQFNKKFIFEENPNLKTTGIGLVMTVVETVYENAREQYENKPRTYTITGRILENGGGLADVSVVITGTGFIEIVKTGPIGSYSLSIVPDGSYTITPSKVGYIFTPAKVSMTISGYDKTVETITATKTGGTVVIQGISFVSIPGGTFQMGDAVGDLWDDWRPVHTVTVSSFEMSLYEITNSQYAKYLNEALATGYITATSLSVKGAKGAYSGQEYIYLAGYESDYPDARCWINYAGGTFTVETGKENYPVVYITWYGSNAFALYYGLDLPTEAEWEYVCRGGRQYKYGTDDGTLSTSKANYWDNGIHHPVDVGSYPKNPYGLYDMSGNVWEWCHDWYGSYSSGSVTNPTGILSGSFRVVRGGGWDGQGAGTCWSFNRAGLTPGYRGINLGFRVVRRASPQNY